MSSVFISYRQTDDAQCQRVRAFAEKLCACGVEVILDQFYLDEHPGGPPEKWPKWSSDRAIKTEHVIIIGTEAWFLCFDGTEKPGTGLGAACEADDLRQRIYDAANVNDNIRVVLFADADSKFISFKLKGYHRFHAERDFVNIVKWLGGTLSTDSPPPKTSILNNLPRLQPFFGREKELAAIREALDPENRSWGALIDGPGGMGKTSLAVRAAYDCPVGRFQRIIFLSVKEREMDDDGERPLTGFILPGFLEMLNELARELGQAEITKSPEDQRVRLLLEALRPAQALLILDNLESLPKSDRDQLFTFVKRLPSGCKAILTSRRRIGSGSEELILEQLDQIAALATLADLARHNKLLAKTSEAERIALYTQTGGKPLLLRWVAGQLGRGSCRSFTDALHFLTTCPKENDPLEFVFGDLVDEFTPEETRVLCGLTYFTLPAKVEHITEVAGLKKEPVETALGSLANRSLVVPDQEEEAFALVPMVAEFLRRKRPEVVTETGSQLEKRAFALIVENGGKRHDCFPVLDAAWPTLAPAMPIFLAGPNDRLQTVCAQLRYFLDFTGRWDERLVLSLEGERKAVDAKDLSNAGWQACDSGWIYFRRGQSPEVLACANRALAYWRKAKAGAFERGLAFRLRGHGYRLAGNHAAAILSYRDSMRFWQSSSPEGQDAATRLNARGLIEYLSGDYRAAERDTREALRLGVSIGNRESIAVSTGYLAALALKCEDWPHAEALAREALSLSEKLGRQELIAYDCQRLAKALAWQGKKMEGLPYARRAVEIFTKLGSSELKFARATLAECEG
ncbi:MAG: AAA family ATPase [Verrucomicrobia bacterium]|nr:AAA family ATPase [Verrucomicrobiota bacterium]